LDEKWENSSDTKIEIPKKQNGYGKTKSVTNKANGKKFQKKTNLSFKRN
jgi:hypothetical protein